MKGAEQQSLTREQKEAVGLLSIGTFLEYFDVMLYVHMAVLLNELFFPETETPTETDRSCRTSRNQESRCRMRDGVGRNQTFHEVGRCTAMPGSRPFSS